MHIFWENVAIVCVIDRFCRLTNGIRCLFLNKHSTKCPKSTNDNKIQENIKKGYGFFDLGIHNILINSSI